MPIANEWKEKNKTGEMALYVVVEDRGHSTVL